MTASKSKANLNLFLITEDLGQLESSVAYLKQEGYEIFPYNTIATALSNYVAQKPDVILIKWNLKNTNVTKVYSFITEALHVPCLVFTDDSNPKVTAALMKSRIQHTLFPPIGGPGIHRRIQILIRGGTKKAMRKRINASRKFGAIKVAGEEVDSDTKWEAVQVTSSSVNSETTWAHDAASSEGSTVAWKGTVTVDENTTLLYYFKGPKKPEYNRALGQWSGFDEKSPILMQVRPTAKEYESVQEGIDNDKNMFSLIQKNPKTGELSFTPDEKPDQENEPLITQGEINATLAHFIDKDAGKKSEESAAILQEAPPLIGTGHLESVLAICVKKALAEVAKPGPTPAFPADAKLQLAALNISSERFKGYLIAAQNEIPLNQSLFTDFHQRLQKFMEEVGENLKNPEKLIVTQTKKEVFENWSQNQAEFSFLANLGDRAVSFGFMSLNQFPWREGQNAGPYVTIEVESWLKPETHLNFDLYLHMPINQKHILYFKKDTALSKQNYDKLVSLIGKTFSIESSQKDDFIAYCLLARLLP